MDADRALVSIGGDVICLNAGYEGITKDGNGITKVIRGLAIGSGDFAKQRPGGTCTGKEVGGTLLVVKANIIRIGTDGERVARDGDRVAKVITRSAIRCGDLLLLSPGVAGAYENLG